MAATGHTRWFRRRTPAAVLAIVTIALASCGSPPGAPLPTEAPAQTDASSVFEKFAGMTGQQRTDELVKAAKQEGALTVYGPDNIGEIAKGFGDEYGIKINFFEGDPESLTARLTQEADAKKYIADAFGGGSSYLLSLDTAGLLGDYESELRSVVPPEAKGEHWTGNRRHPFVAAYNTDIVPADQIPTDYLDFADPRWKGKIALEISDYEWYANLVNYYEAKGMSRADIDAAFSKIAANSKVLKGHSEQMKLLAAGQFGVALAGFVHHVEQLKDDGAPISWGGGNQPTVQPIIMRYEGAAVLAHAPHPAAATLFMDFVLGPEGVQMVRDNHQLPAVPDPSGDPLAGLDIVMADNEGYLKNSAQWSQEYDAMLRHAT
jgi:iron(III) transport system substrate-binding protein